ncbi:MAG: FkbM family methyltransferase [Ignavibacteriales bacterium]|nr:FkbM family methyltransferase [Ignavibacteriales bacterium]
MNQPIERKENWHEDFIVYLASQYRPKIYVELGLYQCGLFNKIVPYADILIGVDVSPSAGKHMTVSEKTVFVNSTTDQFADALKENPISIDMLFIDADHSKESVLKDFWNFFPYVKDHGLILLHDTHPKNLQYTDKGYCGDAYLVIEELKKHNDEFEMMTIPIHPGLTLIRKRKTQLSWESSEEKNIAFAKDYFDRNVNKSITMPAFVSKAKQMFAGGNEIKTVVEIGALDANDSQYFKKVFPSAEVYAIEALPDNYNKYLNGLNDIVCINAVISDRDGEVDFYKKKINGIHSIFNRGNEYGNEVIKLPSYRFETLAKKYNIEKVDMMKIDVEGAAIEVLEGMGGLLSTVKIMHLESESYPFFEGQKLHNEVVKYLEEKGFSLLELTSFPIQPGRLQYDSLWINDVYLNNSNTNEIAVVDEGKNQASRYKIVCITQVYNEIRKENLERFWKFIEPVCDGLVVYDDGSTDGSYEYMLDKAIFTLRAGENDFKNEVNHKKILLEYALKLEPDFILWLDADEVLTANANIELHKLCKYADENNIDGISLHEINLWRSHSWKRIDNSYDLGWFVRLWRVTPELGFKDSGPGLHQQQYPHSISKIERTNNVGVIHYGFASDRSLAFKYLVYRSHGQTGWALERLLDEKTLTLEKVDEKLFPAGLYIDDDKPFQRGFNEALASLDDYKDEVFKPRISIVCLIYKSTDWLKFVYEQVLKYTDLRDKEFYFVANDANEEVLRYLNENYIPNYVWNNSSEQRKEWYINNVYRAWNYAAEKAKGDYLLFINSDMAFSENWVENLFGKISGNNCVASRLVESGKLLSGDHAVSKNFGRTVNDYDEIAFQEFAKTISEENLVNGGLFMPLLIRKDDFVKAGGYPEGNVIPGTEIFNPAIAKKGEACVSGDVVLMQKLTSIGIQHTTTYDSVVYHFQCGEMDSAGTVESQHNEVRTIICNDYLLGRMGEKTMWGFLLSNLPNAVGVDMDSLHVTKNFEVEARKHLKENCPENAVVVQNATFIDLIDNDHFTILYLQDNLRAMGRKSFQQEVNIKHADLLVTNSKITAASYPEYNFEIIPIGVDDDLFRPLDKKIVRSEFNIPNSKVGIFVGDLSEVKGWENVKKVIDNHDEIFWIIVSKDNKQYEKKNCRTFNRIDQTKLAKLLNCADFFILGSPVETQCLAAIEACFCNLPVIMHNTGIFADFMEEERACVGYFGDDFEKGLSEVLEKKYSPREMMFEKKLTINGMVEKWKTLISMARFFAEQKKLKPAVERPPFFSVIVPVYNHDQYLGEALDTLLAQTFTNWEAIIVNDGSTDNTKEVIAKYLSLDKRFKAIHKENGGVSSALNAGIKNAKGEWFCWLSSDDWFEPNKLEIHYKAIAQFPEIKFFTSHWFIYLQQTGQKIKTGTWLEPFEREFQVTRFFWANYVHGNSIAIHKSVFDNVGLFNENLRQGQDFDMWLRISAQYESVFIDNRTCTTRIHPGQTTNSFIEGGVLDSTRALYKFLNQNSFEKLFPLLDLTIDQHILLAINEVIYVTTKDNAFLYKCGFTSVLIEKMLAWVGKQQPSLRNAIMRKIEEIVNFYLKELIHPDVKPLLKKFLSKKAHDDSGYDLVKEGMTYVEKLIKEGDQKNAMAVEIYFDKILKTNADDLKNYSKFVPRLIGFPENQIYKQLDPKDIISWDIKPSKVYSSSVLHKMKFKCSECGGHVRINFISKMEKSNSESNFICPSCKTGYKYDDIDLDKDLIAFNQTAAKSSAAVSSRCVAFFIADASVIGGGTKVLFKHIEWLKNFGIGVVVYSYAVKPAWTHVDVKYIQLKDGQLIENNKYDLFIVFSIFDLPMMLNHAPLEKIVHICQGYEGYHYGVTYEELRSDKHLLTKLHAVPVKNIVVSKHLSELFKEKFDRETEYVPNGVDHKIFYPNFDYMKREKSIVFIGNPKYLLKGLLFLSQAIRTLQNSQLNISGLKLYLIFGSEIEDSEEMVEQLQKELNCVIELKTKQTSTEIAELIRKVSLVACTSWYEGFSLPLLEAMACGTPTITTKNMGAESFCFDGYNSFLIDYGNVTELSRRIAEIFYKKIPLNDVLEKGLLTSIEYSEYNSVSRYIEAYQKLLTIEFDSKNVQKLLNKYQNFTRADLDLHLNNIQIDKSAGSLNDFIEEAKFYLEGNNLELALISIENAIEMFEADTADIDISELLGLAGKLSFALNDIQKAKNYFEQQLNYSPDSSSACLGLGDVLLAENQFENAKAMYEWALKNDPQNLEAQQKLSSVNELLGYEINHTSLVE